MNPFDIQCPQCLAIPGESCKDVIGRDTAPVYPHNTRIIQAAQSPALPKLKKPDSALDTQVGGSHYRNGGIQPVQYAEANKLQYLEAVVVKRVTRHNQPGGKGAQDIEKAIHELQLLKELRYGGES